MMLQKSETKKWSFPPLNPKTLKFFRFFLGGLLILLLFVLIATTNFSYPQIFTILLFIIFTITGWAWYSARQTAQRIQHLIDAAQHVAEGDLSVSIQDEHYDEIGQLAHVFNKMVVNLNTLHRSRDLLSRTMSPAVRQSLIEKGLDFRGITKTVSILFVDIRSFTQLAENHNTEQLVMFLNDYYMTIANQVHIEGGIIGKYGGDSILAYFGALESKPTSETSSAALLTALALQEAIQQLSDRWKYLGMPPVRVGVGISLGPVMAGPIGSEEQFEYTVIGDAVNLASRLQSLTRNVEGIDVILSREVYEALDKKIRLQIPVHNFEKYRESALSEFDSSPFQLVDLGEVLVKGKKEPIHTYGLPALQETLEDLLPTP